MLDNTVISQCFVVEPVNTDMLKTVWFLVHCDTGRRLKAYRTLAGARIAQRARNQRLGFTHRLMREQQGRREIEICEGTHREAHIATWCIEQAEIEQDAGVVLDLDTV